MATAGPMARATAIVAIVHRRMFAAMMARVRNGQRLAMESAATMGRARIRKVVAPVEIVRHNMRGTMGRGIAVVPGGRRAPARSNSHSADLAQVTVDGTILTASIA